MYLYSVLPGDRLLVKKASVIEKAITHSGTYLGAGVVAHLSPSKGLVVEPVEAFAGGQEVKIVENGGICEQLLRDRLQLCQTDSKYRLFGNNCEHLCSYLESGDSKSPQLQGGVAGFAGGVMAIRALRVQNPWAAVGLIALTTYMGARIGAPKPQQGELIPAY
ncbi:MAG: hypothetical protein Q2484_14985 [Candidatus Sedimenticola sp. (ex Thyasira tokunagai)]